MFLLADTMPLYLMGNRLGQSLVYWGFAFLAFQQCRLAFQSRAEGKAEVARQHFFSAWYYFGIGLGFFLFIRFPGGISR